MNTKHTKHWLSLLVVLTILLSVTNIALGAQPAQKTPTTLESSSAVLVQSQDPPPDPIQKLVDATGGTARVSTSGATGMAQFVRLEPASLPFNLAVLSDREADAQAMSFWEIYGDAFGVQEPRRELELTSVGTDFVGTMHVSYQQVYQGVPVFAGVLRVHFDRQGRLTAVNGTFIPDIKLKATPTLNADAAAAIAVAEVAAQYGPVGCNKGLSAALSLGNAAVEPVKAGRASNQSCEEGIVDLEARNSALYVFRANLARDIPGANHLAYEVEVGNGRDVREFVYVDAHSGKVVDQITGIYTDLSRETYDAHFGPAAGPQVTLCRGEGDPTSGIQACDEAHDYAGDTYNYFYNGFGRDSLDDAGLPLISYYDVCPSPANCPWENASWNGQFMSYGNRSSNGRSITGDDTVAHELGHGLDSYTANLIYQWQPGAISEAMSDIYGEAVDQLNGAGLDTPNLPRADYPVNSTATYPNAPCIAPFGWDDSNTVSYTLGVRWLQGEQDWLIRDMWAPSCMGDPDHVTHPNYWCSTGDGGGVHTNSGVVNHHFAMLTDGGTFNGQTITALGIIKAGAIYYRAHTIYLVPASSFADLADALAQSCDDLTGVNLNDPTTGNPSGEIITVADCTEVDEASLAVEFQADPAAQCGFEPLLDPDAPPLCSPLEAPVSIFSEDWEADVGSWTIDAYVVYDPTAAPLDWVVTDTLPGGRTGWAIFAEDTLGGSCSEGPGDQSSVRYLESPDITIPVTVTTPRLAFDHWVATEAEYDGGNVKISVNGGAWQLVPDSAFTFNGYVGALASAPGNTNPLADELAFHGSNGGEVSGSWGQSQVDLSSLARPGDTVRLRFDMGIDGCNGLVGWYVDEIDVYGCEAQPAGTLQGTITESGTGDPIASALVEAKTNPVFTTTTNTTGFYSMTVLADRTYTITASAFAYTSTVTSGVVVNEGATTVQDFVLDPMLTYVVSGTVTDINTGWPLYASVAISGYPNGGVWTNPETGFYSATLPAGITYTLDVGAWADGYLPDTRDVNLIGGQTEDFDLTVDTAACIAPGYIGSGALSLSEDFESATFPPTGWMTYTVGSSPSEDWHLYADGGHSGSNAARHVWNTSETDDDWLVTPQITSLPANAVLSYWETDPNAPGAWYGEHRVLVTADANPDPNTASYTELREADAETSWTEIQIDLSAYAGQDIFIAFNYRGFDTDVWYIDDVEVIEAACAAPVGGGLVVGNVYDGNTSRGLTGAEVANDGGYLATTEATPDDPDVDDGFYTIFSLAGSHTFTATMSNYEPDVDTFTVALSDTVVHDFDLLAGHLSFDPDSYEVTLSMGLSTTRPFTLTNDGVLAATFELVDVPGEFDPLLLASRVIGPGKVSAVLWDQPWIGTGSVHASQCFPDFGNSCILSADDFTNTEPWLIDSISFEGDFWNFGVITPTLYDADSLHWYVYADAGGQPSGYPGDGLGTELWSYTALPTDPEVTVGGPADGDATLDLSASPVALPPGNYWIVFYPLMSFTNWGQYGVHVSSTTNLQVANLIDPDDLTGGGSITWTPWTSDYDAAFRLEGETMDLVPWLSEDPISGTLPSLGSLVVDITFDAGADEIDQPGDYSAQIQIMHDTPYEVANVPVTMTVTAPATWGKLMGDVYSLGHCDVNPAPLEGAEVLIENGTSVSTTTYADGTYVYWIEAGTYTVTMSADGHIVADPTQVTISAGVTTTLDAYLRSDEPCISVAPLSMEATPPLDTSETQVLTLINAGAGVSTFSIVESPAALPWLSEDPASGSVAADSTSPVTVTFTNLPAVMPGTYTGTVVVNTQDAVNSQISVPVTITIAPRPEPTWEKLVTVNDVLTHTFPVTVVADDVVEIVDQVWITWTGSVTFTLVEEWSDSLELVDYAVGGLPGGTAIIPDYGTAVMPVTGVMTVTVTDGPSDWGYAITKTFNVLAAGWETSAITETLWVEGAAPQLAPKVLQFVNGALQTKVYLPLVMRGS